MVNVLDARDRNIARVVKGVSIIMYFRVTVEGALGKKDPGSTILNEKCDSRNVMKTFCNTNSKTC